MRTTLVKSLLACLCIFGFAAASHAAPFSKEVRRACGGDYRKYCSEYGLETMALRHCMDKAGHSLSHACVHALIRAGEVSASEVERRKKSSR